MKPVWLPLIIALVFAPCVALAVAPDYGSAHNWICRPGNEQPCAAGQDAIAVTMAGQRTPQPFSPASDPPVDCFYVYPTVSQEQSTYAGLSLAPEIERVTRIEAGRLTSRCRLFAPLYRQLTGAALARVLAANGTPDWNVPYADVLAAWRWYRAHDNKGRAVVLFGHSQGSILLHRLLAEQIDGKPDQAVLLSAFLAGDLEFTVQRNVTTGGTLQKIPLCTRPAQTGCVYVWSSYRANDATSHRVFEKAPAAPLSAACDSPAAPGGGPGDLHAYLRNRHATAANTPHWLFITGQISGQCIADTQGKVLRVSVKPGGLANQLNALLHVGPDDDPGGWGLHALDTELVQGNILDRIGDETTTWVQAHTTRQ
jgi:hypothetical protein